MHRVNIYDFERWHTMARQSGYRVSRLCTELRVSRRQLQRYTKEIFGLSPQGWLDEERLNKARGMLKECRSVKTVAFDLGFKRISHFSREFKLRYGLSPTAFLTWSDGQTVNGHQRLLD